MKDMYGLDLPRILKYNQMADKLAGNVKKALKLSPFDEFSPIVYFNKQTEPAFVLPLKWKNENISNLFITLVLTGLFTNNFTQITKILL